MQGLINRAIQCFVCDTYGETAWKHVVDRAGVAVRNFEAFLDYPSVTTFKLIGAIEHQVSLPASVFLEDMGTYLVTSNTTTAVRRLLRFGGLTYEDFVLSLDELPERVNLALPDVKLPEIDVTLIAPKQYAVSIADDIKGFDFVVVGILRALADDYGTLAFIDHNVECNRSTITVLLADSDFAAGNNFDFARVRHATG